MHGTIEDFLQPCLSRSRSIFLRTALATENGLQSCILPQDSPPVVELPYRLSVSENFVIGRDGRIPEGYVVPLNIMPRRVQELYKDTVARAVEILFPIHYTRLAPMELIMAVIQCRACRTANEWPGGRPGVCSNCGRQLIPVSFEVTARVCLLLAMCGIFWSVRDLPSGFGTPLSILFGYALWGVGLEFGSFVIDRRFRTGLPFFVEVLVVGVMVWFFRNEFPPGGAAFLLAPFILFKWFASPLAVFCVLHK